MDEIKGIILQPLSKNKYSWKDYNSKTDNFLTYFQNVMKDEIGSRFDINYDTTGYANYLFIPYDTKKYQSFGSYYISNGIESDRSDLKWSFILNEKASNEFNTIVNQKDILDKAEILGEKFEQITSGQGQGNGFHYLLQRPSKQLIDFIANIGKEEKTTTNKKVSTAEMNTTKKFKLHLESNPFDKIEYFKKEESKILNGENAELLVYQEIKDSIDFKVLSRELDILLEDKTIGEIFAETDKVIHYSKNFDSFAPFDLISTKDEQILYIEVKSTTGSDIYFSKNEIEFAHKNIDNYQVKVVKNKKIYDFDISYIITDIYKSIKDSNNQWSFETIKIRLDFNAL